MLFASLAVALIDRKDDQVGGRNAHGQNITAEVHSSLSIVINPH
jgi:hypothetical protein